MADLGNQKIKDTYQLLLQTDSSGNLQNLTGGTPNPFIVNGNLRYVDGNQADGYVLKSDASGNASWGAAGAGTSYWSANTNGSISPSGTSTPIKVLGNISGSSDLYLGDSTDPNPSIIAPTTLTLRGQGSGNDYLILQQDNVDIFIDGSTYVNVDPDSIILNSSSKAVNTAIMADNATQLFYGDATNNVVRLKEHVFITPTGETSVDYSRALFVSGGSLFHSGGTNNPNEAIVAVGNISGTTDLYLGNSAHTASTITAENKLTIKGQGSTNDYLTLENDYIHAFIDGASAFVVQNTPGDGMIVLNASSKNMDTKILTDDGFSAVHVDAGLNLVRLRDKVLISSGSPTDYSQSLYVSGSSLFYSGGNSHHTAAVVAVGDVSGTTDGLFGKNLGVSGRTYLGTIDAAGDSYSEDKILVAQGSGEIEYLTTAQLKADIGDADYWTGNTDGSISPSGDTTAVTIRDDLNVVHGKFLNVESSGSLTQTILFQNTQTYFQKDIKLADNDKALFGTGDDLQISHNGSIGRVDNNTGSLFVTSTNLYLGDTTSEVIAQDNLTVNDNLIVGDNITAGTDTFFVSATSGRTGIKTLSPDAVLTISGSSLTAFTSYNLNGGTATFRNGQDRVLFSDGATTTALSPGDGIQVVDAAGDTYTVNVSSVDNSTNITMTTTFPGEDIQATSFLYNGEPTNSKFLKVYNSTTPVFQVSGDSVMSGTTDLLDIFASSAITNQDVYWTATTDGTSISPSGSNVTTTVRMSGDTHIKGNLGVTGNTYVNGYNYSSRYYINEQIGISYHGASSTYRLFNIDDSSIGIGAYTNKNSKISIWGDVGISGDTNINGVLSGLTDARFGGNLGISGKTFLDDNLRFSSAKQIQWVDSATYIQGTTTQLALDGDLNITLLADNQIKLTSTEMTNVGRVGISGDTNINGVLSGLTDARFGGNLGVSGNTHLDGGLRLNVNNKYIGSKETGGTYRNILGIDGSDEVQVSNSNLVTKLNGTDITVDAEGDITLDANGADIILSDDGTNFGRFKRDSSDFIIKSEGNNNDIVFRGQDAGVTRDALLLDMSDAGTATFNNGVNISGVTSGRTDASFGGNLGISGRTFLGTTDAATTTPTTTEKLLVLQSTGEVETITKAELTGQTAPSYQYISYFSSVAGSLTATNDWIIPSLGGGISNHAWNVNSNYPGSNQTPGVSQFTVASSASHTGIPVPINGLLEGFYCNCRNNGSEQAPRNAALFTTTPDWGTNNDNTYVMRMFGAGNDDGGQSNSRPYFIDAMTSGATTPFPVTQGMVILPAVAAQDGASVAMHCTWTIVLSTSLSGIT